jgi:salicylate hydroxylase
MSARGRIAIVGAGIAGLGTALSLIEHGFEVCLYEQSSQLAEVGAGLQISPNGAKVLQHWGLEAELAPLVCEAAGKEIRLWSTGQRWKLFDLGEDCRQRFGAPYWMVHRGDLHQVLARAVHARAPGSITMGARITAAHATQAGVTLHTQDGRAFTADALIAADGVHSLLRQQCLGEDKAQFMDLLAWRGLVPMARLPEHLRRPVGTNWVGPGAHVITYPVQGGQLMNVVGIVERGDWRGESWNQPGSHDELLQDFGRWHEDVRTLMQHIDQPFKWALLGREPRRGWANGPVCLLGDAAHPTLPFLAQGANMALEDAAVMGRCLAAAATPAQAFAQFEALRWQRTADIVNRSRDNAQRFHNPQLADDAVAVAYVDREWQPDAVRRRYDWLFDYDALRVPT